MGKFYKDHYDVVIIGGALAGMSACLQLQAFGIKDILILEKHNMPGGLATDFVRNGFEIEATLHEMMSIGKPGERLKVGQFFDDMGVNIDWLPVPECYRAVLPNSGIDITLHDGYDTMAKEIDAQVPGTYEQVHELMLLCRRVYDSLNYLSTHEMGKVQMLLKHPDFDKTLGYTATEVLESLKIPPKVIEMLTPYWIYVGNRMDDLPFTIYALLMADYFTGSYVCRGFSHEMSMKLQAKCEENGAQYEFNQEVEKILVKDGKVYGVRTARGDEIHCDYVISGPYPNKVYSQMIEPLSEVPEGAIKMVNGRKLAVAPVSVIMLLDGTPEENGIMNYSTFSGTTMDTNKIWENYSNLTEPYNYITTICLNYANPGSTPEGMTQVSITALVPIDPWLEVKEEEYFDLKRRLADEMIQSYIDQVGHVDFRSRIHEFEVTSPVTISHYVGAWKGQIYGYLHSMSDHAVARKQMVSEDHFIDGLEFAGAHGLSGDGMGPQVTNGRAAAKFVKEDMEKKEAKGK